MRLRRSVLLWWTATFVVAALTGLAVTRAIGDARTAAARLGGLRLVPVAARPVPAGQMLTAADVTRRSLPAAALPDAAVVDDPVGRVARTDLVTGDVLVVPRLAPDGLRGPAALLPPGMRAVAVPASAAGLPPLSVGDRVDLLATVDLSPATVLAAGRLVVHVDAEAGLVTLAVTPAEAAALAQAVSAAVLTLALTAA